MPPDINEILKSFGITEPIICKQIYRSAWDINSEFILKQSGNLSELLKSVTIAKALTAEGLPVAIYQTTTDNQPYLINCAHYYSLMSKIKGTHLSPFSGDQTENAREFGRIIARLHLALKKIESEISCHESDLAKELNGWILKEISGKNIKVRPEIIDRLKAIEPAYSNLPRQLIHRDPHTENFLFDQGEFAGYLDFDLCQKNARIFDLCYFGATLLVDRYSDPEKFQIWQNIFGEFVSTYDAIYPIRIDEKELMPDIFVFDELIFTAFYSKIGQPDVSAKCLDMTDWLFDNRDFIRAAYK
jgi:Ser/Thr protein kinase RdoA (MazF antagonist)